jgi:hypothetical protein
MSMKRYRLGLDYRRQLNWFLNDYRYGDYGVRCGSYEIVEARIAHEKFLVRVQKWIVLRADEVQLPREAIRKAHVCEHFSGVVFSRGPLQEMLICRMSHWKEQDVECPQCSGLKQCPQCDTEFQIDTRELGSRGLTIVITTWWDLGPGISPYDPEYRRHCSSERFHRELDPQVVFEAGSIQGAFEDHQELSIDSLLKANRTVLGYYIPVTKASPWADV